MDSEYEDLRADIYHVARDILAALFETSDRAAMVAEAAGVPRYMVSMDGPASTVWDQIMQEARKRPGALGRILQEARRIYPDNQQLVSLSANHAAAVSITRVDEILIEQVRGMREDLRAYMNRLADLEERVEGNAEALEYFEASQIANSPLRTRSLFLGVIFLTLPQLLYAVWGAEAHGLSAWIVAAPTIFVYSISQLFLAYAIGVIGREP